MQIQQLLVNQLGYSVSVSFAPNTNEPLASNFNLTIQKNAEEEQSTASSNETPESAPATASGEGIVTAHEQEKDSETEFNSTDKGAIPKDKKRYVGGGVEYEPGKGARFFGLGQLSRFPFLTDSINSLSAKGGGQGTTGPIGPSITFQTIFSLTPCIAAFPFSSRFLPTWIRIEISADHQLMNDSL